MEERLKKQLDFALEVDKEKNIFRQTHLSGHGRNENDAEHAPEEQKAEMIALFDEFEAYETPESKYAHAMDNLQPLILNNSNDGSDWKEHCVKASQVYSRQNKTRLGSETLYQEVTDKLIKEHIRKGNIRE